jgi:hypothetical protein
MEDAKDVPVQAVENLHRPIGEAMDLSNRDLLAVEAADGNSSATRTDIERDDVGRFQVSFVHPGEPRSQRFLNPRVLT